MEDMDAPQPIHELFALLGALDGQPFDGYQQLSGRTFEHEHFHIRFVHIQGSPGAFPASVCQLFLPSSDLGLAGRRCSTTPRKVATADYLLRAFASSAAIHARQNRGSQGSGSFQPLPMPPQVLRRNVVAFNEGSARIAFHVSLPGSRNNRILSRQAQHMFATEMNAIVCGLRKASADEERLKEHCDVVEDMLVIQERLADFGLVAFVGDGAILPRRSSASQAPLKKGAVAFYAPDNMAVEMDFPNAGRVRGLGIRQGVSVLVGGGYHGKSTLLDALAKGVYPHIPGDGREQVITHPDAAVVCAEEGRSVSGLDITGFIDRLPGDIHASHFWTQNASGSTSEAAAIIEAVLAGAKFLLVDEDSSAINFLVKDPDMRTLIPEDPITPLVDRIRDLHRRYGVSTLVAMGASAGYLGVADQVIAIRNYLPVSVSGRLNKLSPPQPETPADLLKLSDNRRLLPGNFNPAYRARRLDKTVPVRIKPLRLREKVLEYGNEALDLTTLAGLVDPHQVVAVGYALLLARDEIRQSRISPSDLAARLVRRIEEEGLGVLNSAVDSPVFLAYPRRLELAGAINRIRNLKVEVVNENGQAGHRGDDR
jgi:predicted ABC-class ATPase